MWPSIWQTESNASQFGALPAALITLKSSASLDQWLQTFRSYFLPSSWRVKKKPRSFETSSTAHPVTQPRTLETFRRYFLPSSWRVKKKPRSFETSGTAHPVNTWALESNDTASVFNQSFIHKYMMIKSSLEQATKAQRGSRGIALLFL